VIRLFYILIFLSIVNLGHAQSDNNFDDDNSFDDTHPFEIRQLNVVILDSNQIKIQVNTIQNKSIVCYRDSLGIVRIAYSLSNKNKWISFETPFFNITSDFELINIDNKRKPEIVVKGTMSYESWPYGERHNDAILIYQINSSPTQIFKLFYRCNEFNVGSRVDGEGAYNYTTERKVRIENGDLIIEKYISDVTEIDVSEGMDECHFTEVEAGIYKLKNGRFIRE
jgi:hypothetical protein